MAEHKFYITRLKNLHKHPNADRLQIGECFGNSVIVSMAYTDNQLGVYFPTDLQLSEKFCQVNDLVRRKDENGNPAGGYMDPNKRNVTAVRLRGEKSDGLFLPLTCLAEFTTISELREGEAYDTLNGEQICCKYIPRRQNNVYHRGSCPKKAKINFCPTFHEHVETEQMAYNLDKFHVGDTVELTLKMHGTSGRTGYLPVIKYKKSWLDKLLKREGKQYMEYEYVNGTRRVVLDENHDGGYYEDNSFRLAMANKFHNKLKKGEVAYYEIVGFQGPNGAPIMSTVQNNKISDKAFIKQYGKETVFSYGCVPHGGYDWDTQDTSGDVPPCCDIYVYRMTMVNEDGDEIEYSPDQIRYRCEQMGINAVPVFTRFIIPEHPCWCHEGNSEEISTGEYVLRLAELCYDGADPVGKTHIREGVVARIVNRNNYAVYKHKNFNFKVLSNIAVDHLTDEQINELPQDILEEM